MITLKTLSQASAQEVFDQVANHLLVQNKRSISESSRNCMYRGHKNTFCAAGCLIADDEYDEKLETNSWAILINRHLVPAAHSSLIIELQVVHDNYYPIDWKKRLINLGNNYNLNTNIIK